MAKLRLKLTPQEYEQIDAAVNPQGTEVYSVATHKHRGQIKRSIHVFERIPNEHELQTYESLASSVKFRGKDATVKGSPVMAAKALYDTLITRVYDYPQGPRVIERLTGELAKKTVDALTKRAAMIDLVGQVWAASNFDDEDEDDVVESPEPTGSH